jgi:acetyltransferase
MSGAAYPADLEHEVRLADGTIVRIRPIRPDDAAGEQAFVRALSVESRYFRFMDSQRELSPHWLERFTRIDYDREMALIALVRESGTEVQIGVARYVILDEAKTSEFAIVVADAWQRKGVALHLMNDLIAAARRHGVRSMCGEVLASNHKMHALMEQLGFVSAPNTDDPALQRVSLRLEV